MHPSFKSLLLAVLTTIATNANAALPLLENGMPYAAAKDALIAQGWMPVNNPKIAGTSLYAQEIYEQGLEEVVDCISMELDACWFHYAKDKQVLEVKTITRQLKLESFEMLKTR